MKPSVLLPAVGLPILQTGIRSCHLGTENPVVSRGTITRYSGLSSFSARSLGTDAAGVTPWQNTIALVMGEKGEKCFSSSWIRGMRGVTYICRVRNYGFKQRAVFKSTLRSYFASHSCCLVTQVLSLAVDSDIVYAAVEGLGGTVRPGTQTWSHYLRWSSWWDGGRWKGD